MDYIVCQRPGELVFSQKAHPVRLPGEILVKIRRIGICGTDLHAYAGNQAFFSYPRILGHELAGEVADAGDHPGFHKGDRVAIIPYLSCGTCIACRAGKTNCCVSLKVYGVHVDGGMQEYFSFPPSLLIPSPTLDWDEMAIVEPLCVAAHAVERASVAIGQTVLVMGCGPIGLALVAFAKLRGANVIAVDMNPKRLEVASTMGAGLTLAGGSGVLEEVETHTGGELCQVVFDATGNKQAMESGVSYVSHGGKYVLVGLYKDQLSFHHPSIHAKEISILCSRNATKTDFEYVMGVLASGSFPTSAYITHRTPFKEMMHHFDSWAAQGSPAIKVVVILP